jgi:hypothetical protein
MTTMTTPSSTSPDPRTTRGALPVWPSVLGALSLVTLFVGARLLVEPNAAVLAVAIALNVGAA